MAVVKGAFWATDLSGCEHRLLALLPATFPLRCSLPQDCHGPAAEWLLPAQASEPAATVEVEVVGAAEQGPPGELSGSAAPSSAEAGDDEAGRGHGGVGGGGPASRSLVVSMERHAVVADAGIPAPPPALAVGAVEEGASESADVAARHAAVQELHGNALFQAANLDLGD